MRVTIQAVNPERKRRILVVSDIHGNGIYLKKLLEQAHFTSEDILIIVGDVIDKGMESLNTLQYVMGLCQSQDVYVTMGNVELSRILLFDDDTEEGLENFVCVVHQINKVWGGGLFDDMLRKIGLSSVMLTSENVMDYKHKIRQHFAAELDFLRSLPTILESERYIFVHGGIPTDHLKRLDLSDASAYLKNDHFLEKGYSFDKYVVVGHWPVCLYDSGEGNNPLIDYDKHIISIDGGNALKKEGQLNLLIMPHISCDVHDITWIYEDGYPKAKILEPQSGQKAQVNIIWTDNKVTILQEDTDTAVIKHISTGSTLTVAKSYLWNDDICEDTSDALLDVSVGDIVSVIETTKKGFIVKKDGRTGWYFGRLE